MTNINRWLLQRLDSLPDPEPLPPHLEELRAIVERRMARVLLLSMTGAGVYAIARYGLSLVPGGLLIMIPLVFVICVAMLLVVAFQARMVTRDYARWLQEQPPVPSRVMRMGVPYERQAPVATVACSECSAGPGQRHSRSCPSVPPEWFKR